MPEEPKELNIVIPDDIQRDIDADPELAEAFRNFCASIRQAHHAVQTGQYENIDDAMEAITGNRPERIDEEDIDSRVTRVREEDE